MSNTQIKSRIKELTHNELVEALHTWGIAPNEKYGAANWVQRDRQEAERALAAKIAQS